MKAFDLNFEMLNEDEEDKKVESAEDETAEKDSSTEDNTEGEEKEEKSNKPTGNVSDETLDKAIDALKANRLDDENIVDAVTAIFGDDGAILPNSDADTIAKNADKFVKIAKENGVDTEDDKGAEESDTDSSTTTTDKKETLNASYNYGHKTIEALLLEAEADTKAEKKTNFIRQLLDKIMGSNKAAQENGTLKQYNKRVKKAKETKSKRDTENKNKANDKANKVKTAANMSQLVGDYKKAGSDFVAHTCTMTYKMLSKANKDSDIKELAKTVGKTEGSEAYLKGINDINERKHVDSGACALALAIKYKEAKADKKSPYAAKNMKEAMLLASRYKKAFPKYYNRAHNQLSDAYTEGIKEAQEKLRKGESLKDPLTGEEVNREILAPLWSVGSKLNDFFSKQPLNVATIGPKMIFGLYNALTSKTAKNIYKGLFKFGRAVAQHISAKKQTAEAEDNKELFDCSIETLTNEFDESVKQHAEDSDEVDNSEKEENQEEQKQEEGKPEEGKPEEGKPEEGKPEENNGGNQEQGNGESK